MRVEDDALLVDLRVAGPEPVDERSPPELGAVGLDDRVDRPLARLADLVVGERAVRRAVAQREGEAPAAGAERVGPELVEAAHRLEQVAAGLRAASPRCRPPARSRAATNARSMLDAGKRDSGVNARSRRAPLEQPVDVDLDRDRGPRHLEAVQHRGRERADVADGAAVDQDRGGARRVEAGDGGVAPSRRSASSSASPSARSASTASYSSTGRSASTGPRATSAGEQHREVVALVGQEVPARPARRRRGRARRARGPARPWLAFPAAALSSPGRICGRRIGSSARSAFVASTVPSVLRPNRSRSRDRDERHGHRLGRAGADEDVLDHAPVALARGEPAADAGGVRQRARDLVEPDPPGDLLDDVDLALEVGTERRGDRDERRGVVRRLDPDARAAAARPSPDPARGRPRAVPTPGEPAP